MKKFTKILFVLLLGAISLFASCKKEINEVTFKNVPTTMYVDDSFTVEYSKQDKVTATFVSSNTSVATVAGEKVTAVAAGEFTLTATFSLGKKTKEYKHTITVVDSEYNITYNLNGGNLADNAPSKYSVKNLPLTLVNPTREGYTFAGWYTTENYSGNAINNVAAGTTGALNLYAKWDLVNYNINYHLDGGVNSDANPATFTLEDEVLFDAPTKAGYEFLGWYADEAFTNVLEKVEKGTKADVDVYAKWNAFGFVINYHLDGGVNNESNPATFTVEDEVVLSAPTKAGYNFLGWYADSEYTVVLEKVAVGTSSNVDAYAKWEVVNYNINYNLDGGTNNESNPATFTVEDEVVFGDPTKVGYNFLGWYADSEYTVVLEKVAVGTSADVNAYAKWELANYNINYELDGGVNSESNPATFTIEDEVVLSAPTKKGYNFLGWYADSEYTVVLEKVAKGTSADVNAYAKWEKIIVIKTIKYVLDGGENPASAPTSYEVGVGCELPVPTREGYNFLGWTLSKVSTTYVTKVTTSQKNDLVLYAKWEKIVVYSEIVYELNGGVLPQDAASKYEEGKEFVLPVPTLEGYKFLGWSKEEGSTNYIEKLPATSTGKVTVYANWEENKEPVVGEKFTVKYELNGGAWSWTTATVTAPASGINAVSNLPEIFMADFYTYLVENNLLASSKVSTKLQVSTWAAFSAPYGDPVAWYNATSTGGYSAADGYSELFFDSVNGYEAVGGFLGTSPYKEKYANLTKHMIQLTTARYATTLPNTKNFKGACGFVLDGYFYGTQGLRNDATFDTLRGLIPTPTVGYEGSVSSENTYVVTDGVVGTELKLVAPVREGHMFLGWYDNAEFTGEKLSSVSSGCTLYAYWLDLNAPAPTFKIEYELNGGTNNADAPTSYTLGETVELLKPNRSGYTFLGWSTDAAGKNIINEISATSKGDLKLYANWSEGEEEIYTIEYKYSEGSLPTYTVDSLDAFAAIFWEKFHAWSGSSLSVEAFKSGALAAWATGADGGYKLYLQNARGQVNEGYFVHSAANIELWTAWMDVVDAKVTEINGSQTAWGSNYVGYLRIASFFNQSASYWTAARTEDVYKALAIPKTLVTEYKPGDSFELLELSVNDGRTFLGWYDQNGNKVEKITATTTGDFVLTAKWSEAIPVETFEVTNKVNRLLKLSTHQLTWNIGPSNATFKKLTFASSNESVLRVSENGLIEAVSVGTAKVLITVHGNTALNMELEIEVYIDPYIDGEFTEQSYIVAGTSTQLSATLVGGSSNKLTWTSNTPSIATVDADGTVSGLKEGLAEIVVSDANNPNTKFTFYVTVLGENPTGMLKLLLESNNAEIYTREHLLIGIKIGSDGAYYSDIVGSVSKLLFEDYAVYDEFYLANPNNKSNLSTGGIQFITVHYAADMPYSASAMFNGGRNLASYNKSCNTNGTQASWHYSVGNDGIWACQNEAYGAWHAGSSKTMTWSDSGVTTTQVGSDVLPTDVKLGSDGYFYIKGVKTTVKNTTSSTKLNGMGLAVKLEGNKWYLGGHYYNSSYQYISSTGGNNNSIGMETSVREGSDLWLTWQYTAQLCAKLLLKYQLPIQRLVGHHFFSGKWCPQPMLENDLEIWYEFVDLTRKQMDLYQNYADYKLTFASESSYLKDNGRVKELPNYPECVTYTVTYATGSTTKTVTLSSILPGNLE